jgi:hypothetical protein
VINTRSGGWLGLGIGAVLAVWWLAAVQFAVQNGFDATTPSTELLDALWLARMIAIFLLAPVLGLRLAQWRGLQPILCMAWMSLPLVVLGAAAAAAPWHRVLMAELALLAAAGLAYGMGWALQRLPAARPFQDPAGFAVGAGLAGLVWANRAALLPGWLT